MRCCGAWVAHLRSNIPTSGVGFDLDDSVPAEPDDHGGTDDGATMPAGDIKDVWRMCEPEQRRALLRDHVGVLVAAVMGLPSSQSLNPSRTSSNSVWIR